MLSNLKRIFEKMREGLRSQTRRTAEKAMIDLNKDPVENDGSSSKSPPSSAYFSAEDKVDSGLDVDVTSNAVGGNGAGGKEGEILNHGEIAGGFEGNLGGTSPLTNDGSVREGLSEGRALEGNRDATIVGGLDLNASGGIKTTDEDAGRRRRGRGRKIERSGLSNAVGGNGAGGKEGEIFNHGEISGGFEGNLGGASPLTNYGSVREWLSEGRPLEGNRDAATVGGLDLNASGSIKTTDEAAGRRRRGRRKKMESGLSNAVGGNGEGGKEGGIFNHGEISGGFEGNLGGASPLTNDGSVREGWSDGRPLEGTRDTATVGGLDLNASGGIKTTDEAPGRRRRGRRRKMEGSGLSNDGGLKRASVGNEGCEGDPDKDASVACVLSLHNPGAAIVSGLDPNASSSGLEIKSEAAQKGQRGRKRRRKMEGCGLSSAQSLKGGSVMEEEIVAVARAEEDGIKNEILEQGNDADVVAYMVAAPAGNTDEGGQQSIKNQRGRKRKELESSGGNKDNMDAGGETKRLVLDGASLIVGRVLRSRTREANAAEMQAFTEEKGLGDTKGEMDLERSADGNVEMEIEESARTAVNLKRGRGRPPKRRRNGSSQVTVNNKANLGSQKKFSLPGAKVVKGQKLVKLHKRKVRPAFLKVHKGNKIEKKEVDMRPKEEKLMLKDQIMSILKKAGWTIEYRPRNGRDYLDAVYVDGHGRTHWSVTLAYKKLKQKIENGTADDKEISAFTPIPGDKLSKLFRITQEGKKSKKGLKAGGISKERPDRKSTGGCIAISKTKANITSGPQQGENSLEKKIGGVNCERENSIVASCMRKPKSRRGGSRKPCGLLARESKDELDEGKGTLLSWMIDLGTILPGDKVRYTRHATIDMTHEGKITREGICCECCGKIFTLVDFECHAGSSLGQPLQNICLESGQSLLQCMSESWSTQEEIDHIGFNFVNIENDPDDDTCNICADGGDLICCDGCPSTFHQSCLQIQNFPTGDWHCVYCSCKFCGMVCLENSQGDNVLDPDASGYFTCLFCEEKFHINCMLRKEDKNINAEVLPFCGRGCQKLFENLQKLFGVKHELEKGYSWTILRRQDLSITTDSLRVESNAKLAIALSIIDECFTPITDERSNIDLIRSVCYSCGSNLRRLNYSGFCTFILEKNDELVSAATIRIHGNQLAEMPFIGTRGIHRRKGMCRLLLTAIEMVLSSLDVEKLVIPAVSELNETWTKVFSFAPLEESRRQEMKYMSLVVFPGADLLQKSLCKYHFTEGETSAAGVNLPQPSNEHMNGNSSPREATSAMTVGSGLHLTCDGPGIMHGSANSITTLKDELCHDFDASDVKLENSKSGTPEGNQVDKISCVPVEGKEALQSQHKTAVCSQ